MRALFLFFFSFSAFSADYHCYVRTLRLDFHEEGPNSMLTAVERQSGVFLFNDIVRTVQVNGELEDFLFQSSRGQEFVMTFKSEDLKNGTSPLFGTAQGSFGYGSFHDSLKCVKSTL